MKTETQFIFRLEEPFEKGIGDKWDNKDINTLGCRTVFEGYVGNIEDISKTPLSNKTLLNYDIVKDIEGYCYVRTIEIRPGSYQESWREPTENEMYKFIESLKENFNGKGDLNENIIYQWYRRKARNLKIDSIIE